MGVSPVFATKVQQLEVSFERVQQGVDMLARRRCGACRGIDNVVDAQPQVPARGKTRRGVDHVFGRQKGDQMRRTMVLQGIGKARQRGDQKVRHGAAFSSSWAIL